MDGGGVLKFFLIFEFAGDRSPRHARNREIEKWTGARLFCFVANQLYEYYYNSCCIPTLPYFKPSRHTTHPPSNQQHAIVEHRYALPHRSIIPMAV